MIVAALLLAMGCFRGDDSLQVIPARLSPDELVASLRDGKLTTAECVKLGILFCDRYTDLTLRYVQLDEDLPMEAIVTIVDWPGWVHQVFVFDRQKSWNQVGSLVCSRSCRHGDLVGVQKITEQLPNFLRLQRDLGGSGSIFVTEDFYGIRDGRLRQVFQFMSWESPGMGLDPASHRRTVFFADSHLVVHTRTERVESKTTVDSCEVWQWNSARFQFVKAPQDSSAYCDPATGQPIPDKSEKISVWSR